jgi:large subunit ribosomal protein L31
MKEGIHPDYREVVFQDASSGWTFLTRSTLQTDKTIFHEGKEYPLFTVEITSDTHPFFTGKQKILDAEGRVEKFRQKYGMKSGKK